MDNPVFNCDNQLLKEVDIPRQFILLVNFLLFCCYCLFMKTPLGAQGHNLIMWSCYSFIGKWTFTELGIIYYAF